MPEPQKTRMTLLARLRDCHDRQAWGDFVDLYSPVVYGFARRQGLQDADAADLVQEVLRSVSQSIGNYDHRKGRFRSWLMSVVRNRLSDYWTTRGRRVAGSGDTGVQQHLAQLRSPDDTEQLWEQEYRQRVFRIAASRVRNDFEESTWQAFWQTNVEGKSTREVAQSLGISEGAVYIAKSRGVDSPDNHLGEIKPRLMVDEVPFQVGPRYIQLAGNNVSGCPQEVRGIEVNGLAEKVHILHGTRWTGGLPNQHVATYTFHYEDGTSAEPFKVITGRHLREWWHSADKLKLATRHARVVGQQPGDSQKEDRDPSVRLHLGEPAPKQENRQR